MDSTNLQHSSWEIWNDAEEWFCFIGFDSGWRDGVCCFKKYLRFRIDLAGHTGVVLLCCEISIRKLEEKGIVGKLSWN